MIKKAQDALLAYDKELFKAAIRQSSTEEINEKNKHGDTLLHLAIQKGSLHFVKYLLASGADISLENKKGNSALHFAVQQGYYNIVHEMLGVSLAAQGREKKTIWINKNRHDKFTALNISKNKALNLLNVSNTQGEIPLIIAAKLKDDLIYKNLLPLESAQGYSKDDLDNALILRKKHIRRLKNKSLWSAILETFCPSASLAELTESFAYTGLLAGASTAVILGLNIAFGVISILGFSTIMYANYKRIQSEKNAVGKLEELQIEQAFLKNVRKRIAYLSSHQPLTPKNKDELALIKERLSKNTPKPILLKGNEKNAADYVTPKDKILTALSSTGSFLCTYAGLMGIAGLGLAVTAEIMSTSISALIMAAGPIGMGAMLSVGLIFAGILAFYHYENRKQNYLVFGEQRVSIHTMQYTIYQEQQHLIYSSDGVLEQIKELLHESPRASSPKIKTNESERQPLLIFDKSNHESPTDLLNNHGFIQPKKNFEQKSEEIYTFKFS